MKTNIFRWGTYGTLTAISDARDDLHVRYFSMLITAVAFIGTARMRDH